VNDGDEHANPGGCVERPGVPATPYVSVVVVLLGVDGPIRIERQHIRRVITANLIGHDTLACPPRPRVRKVSAALREGSPLAPPVRAMEPPMRAQADA